MATFSLLGGVPMMESPEESQRANAALGMAQGNAAVGNFLRMREMRRMENRDAVADQRWDELRPLREAQLDAQKIELEGAKLNQRLFQASKLEELENKSLMDDSWWRSKMWNLKGWDDESEADYYNWLSKNPQLGATQWAKNMQDQFNFSKRAREAAALKQAELDARIQIAEMRNQEEARPDLQQVTAEDGSTWTWTGQSYQQSNKPQRDPVVIPATDPEGNVIPGVGILKGTNQKVTYDAEAYEDAKKMRGKTPAASPGTGQSGPVRIRFDKDGKRIE